MAYVVGITPRVRRRLRQLPSEVQERLERAFDAMAADPKSPPATPITDPPEVYGRQFNETRLIYRVYDARRLVEVTRIQYRP